LREVLTAAEVCSLKQWNDDVEDKDEWPESTDRSE
jgi:hypothetical protein